MIIFDEDSVVDAAELASWIDGDEAEVWRLVSAGAIRETAPGSGMFALVASIKAAVEHFGGAWESIPGRRARRS